jgi:hypothetical protein
MCWAFRKAPAAGYTLLRIFWKGFLGFLVDSEYIRGTAKDADSTTNALLGVNSLNRHFACLTLI